MKLSFQAIDYALISPRHLQAILAGLLGNSNISGAKLRGTVDRSRSPRASILDLPSLEITRSQDNEDGQDDPNAPPWWESEDIYGDRIPVPQLVGTVAVIPIKGVVTSGLPRIYRAFGFVDTEELTSWVQAAASNPSVTRIILDIDSPGGMVMGTPELATAVNTASLSKRIDAHTKGMMDSAAYWVASQCNNVWCTPSADVGCIGVYQVHYDWSGCLEEAGIKAEMFRSGDLKGAGHPDFSLSKDQREHFQSQIDLIGKQFRGAVKTKRTMVADDSMRGQSFLGTEAASRHLVAGLRSFASLL